MKENENIISAERNIAQKKKIQIEKTGGNSEDGDYAMEEEGIALDRKDNIELNSNEFNKDKDGIKKHTKKEVDKNF